MLGSVLDDLNVLKLVSILLLTSLTWLLYQRKRVYLPPGPIGLPLFGYLPFLSSKPDKDFGKLTTKYGDIICVKTGLNNMVVLHNAELIQEAFRNPTLLSRPTGFFHLSDEYKTLLELQKDVWKEHIKFNAKVLKELGMGNNRAEESTANEVRLTLEYLEKQCGKDIDILDILRNPVSNIIQLFFTGKTYAREDPMNETMKEFQEITPLIIPTAYSQHVPGMNLIRQMTDENLKTGARGLQKLETVVKQEITIRQKQQLNEYHLYDYVDYFLAEIKKRKDPTHYFTEEGLLGETMTFMLGGSDTTLNSLTWLMLQMANDQEIQQKVYKEIETVIGTSKIPSWNDKDKLPYTEAVILESSRRNIIASFGLLRCAEEDTKISGFDIPKGTNVFANLAFVHSDPRKWKDPDLFKPERFLTENGQMLSKLPDNLMPFSYGKRKCPGDKLAIVEIFLFFVSIIQNFHILPPECGVRFDSENFGIRKSKYPFIRIKKR